VHGRCLPGVTSYRVGAVAVVCRRSAGPCRPPVCRKRPKD